VSVVGCLVRRAAQRGVPAGARRVKPTVVTVNCQSPISCLAMCGLSSTWRLAEKFHLKRIRMSPSSRSRRSRWGMGHSLRTRCPIDTRAEWLGRGRGNCLNFSLSFLSEKNSYKKHRQEGKFHPQIQKTWLDCADQSGIWVHFEVQFLYADRCTAWVNFGFIFLQRQNSRSKSCSNFAVGNLHCWKIATFQLSAPTF